MSFVQCGSDALGVGTRSHMLCRMGGVGSPTPPILRVIHCLRDTAPQLNRLSISVTTSTDKVYERNIRTAHNIFENEVKLQYSGV